MLCFRRLSLSTNESESDDEEALEALTPRPGPRDAAADDAPATPLLDGSRCEYVDARRFKSPVDPATAAAAARIIRTNVARHRDDDGAQTSLLVDCRGAGPDLFPFFRGLLASFSRRPRAYARVVFAATDRLADGFIVGVVVSLRPDLRDRVISLRTAGVVPSLALARLGFRKACLPATVRADYATLLDDEDTL